MKKLLYFLSFSMIVSSVWSQTPSGCFSSGNDVSFSTVANPTAILGADFDNDGIKDVMLSVNSGTSLILPRLQFHKGIGNGKFLPYVQDSAGNAIFDIKSGDFNNDGILDIAAGNNGGSGANIMRGLSIHYGIGNGTFSSGPYYAHTAGFTNLDVADINNDTRLDIACVRNDSIIIYLGSTVTPGTFVADIPHSLQIPTGSYGVNPIIYLKDFNSDGLKDIIISNSTNTIYLYLNNSATPGSYTLQSTTIISGATGLKNFVVSDLNNDGKLDIISSNETSGNISVCLNTGSNSFAFNSHYTVGNQPRGIQSGDLNGDGNNDIIVSNMTSSNFYIYYGNGTGALTFNSSNQAAGTPNKILLTDLNTDGILDATIANGNTGSFFNVFLGNASHNYAMPDLYTTANAPKGIHSNDFNNDGKADIVYTNPAASSFSIRLSTGSAFSAETSFATSSYPVSIFSGDLNNDGNKDVVTADSAANQVTVFFGNGSGGFGAGASYAAGNKPVSVKLGHLNGDTYLDIAVVNQVTGNVTVLTSSGGATPNFNTLASYSLGGSTTPKDLTIADVNNDTYNDIFVVCGITGANVYRLDNSVSGTLTINGTIYNTGSLSGISIVSGDIDNDTDKDIVVLCSNLTSQYIISRLWNNGSGTLTVNNSVSMSGVGVQNINLIDVNSDNKYEAIIQSSNSASSGDFSLHFAVTVSGTNGTYMYSTTPYKKFATMLAPRINAVGDFDADGRTDIAITNISSNQISIHYNKTPKITAGGPLTFCNGNSVTLTSTSALWYNWSPNSETTQAISATTSGTYYTTTSSSWSDWCSSSSNALVVAVSAGPSAPTITNSGGSTICQGNTVTLTSSQATGNQWYKDGGIISGATNQTYVASTSGSYTVTYTNAGCTSPQSAAVVLTVSQTPVITAQGPTSFCTGGSVILHSTVGTNITWSPGGATTQDITVSTAGTYTATNNVAGCPALVSNSITVTISGSLSTPTISPAGPVTLCPSGTVTLTSSSATNNIWSTGATTQSIVVNSAGSYYVHLDNGSCSSANSTPVSVSMASTPATPTITAGGPTTFCAGGSVTLTASAGTTYLWSTGATTASINVTTSGSYTVQVTNAAGCLSAASAPTSVTVNALPATPTITAGGPTTFCAGGSVTLTASAGTTYLWSPGGATTSSISATTSGSYTVQVTNAAGCLSASSTPTSVTVNALPATPTITPGGPTTFCAGGSVTLTSSAGTTYLWSPGGATTSSISATTSGSYTVQVTNAAGCLSAASTPTVVTVNALPTTPTITAGGPTTFCAGGSVTLTSSAGTTYLWSPGGATTSSISATTSGSYTVQVTNAAGCLSAASAPTSVTVNALPATPTITAGGPTTFCAGGSVTLTSSAGTTYLWSPGGATTSSISATTSGSYTVQVTNAAGCLSAASLPKVVTVNTAPSAPTITPGGPTTFCSGGSVTLTASAGTTYLWSPGGATTSSISAITSGSYTVQVTNAAGCLSPASAPTVVTVNAAPATPTITAGGPTTFCSGGSVTLTASAGTTYLWSTGATTASISPTTSGSYTVQVTNAAGCLSAASAPTTVTVTTTPATPTITPGGSTSICAGNSVTLTASAGTTYLWSTGATTASINVTAAGSYTVQVTNAGGCLSASSTPTTVTVNPLPSAPTITPGGPTTFCAGGSVTLTSSAGTTYLWSTGATTASISPTTSGSYTVQVTNAAGCLSSASAPTTVTVNAAPSAPTISAGGPTTFCAGGSVILTASAGTTYLWSTGATTASITVTAAGSYTVQVTNAGGCLSPASAPTTVTVNTTPAAPTITPGGPTTFCAGGSVTLTSSAGTSYLWSTGATTASINVTAAGSYTVQVTTGGCTSPVSSPTTVTINALPATPTITAGGSTTFCAGGSVTLTSSAGTSYLWSTGATTASISATTSGSYTVQVTNPAGCLSAASTPTAVTVNALPATPTITPSGSTSICTGGSVILTASAGTTYLWSTGATTASITVTAAGSYTVQVTNAAGCLSPASAPTTVTVNALPATPTITAGGSTTFCAGGSVTLTASAGTTYLWSTGATTASISATTSGSYTVQVTNAAGCLSAASAPTTVTVNTLPATPTITAGGPTSFCAGGSVTLTASAGTTYLWSTGETTASISATASGSYTVQVTNAAGCLSAASAPTTVTVNALPATPTITASGTLNFCLGGSVTLTSSAGTTYLWSTGETTQSIVVTTTGSYTVQVTNAAGCLSASSAPKNVNVNPLPGSPTISAGGPTTFCAGGSVTLTSTASFAYLWSTGETTQSIIVTSSGNYSVQQVNGSGCQSSPSNVISVTVNPLPAAPAITSSGSTTFCAGGSVTLTSGPGVSYLWSTGETTASINVTTSGSYTVQITNSNGCISPMSPATNVTVNPIPSVPTITVGGPTTFCSGGSVILTSSASSNNLWSTGETTQSITVTTSGSYTVEEITGGCASGNSVATSVTVNPNPPVPTITPGGPTTFCVGNSVVLTSSAASGNLWSTSAATQSITVTTSGSYSVDVTNGFGCTSSSSPMTVIVNPIPSVPTITAGGPTTFCSGNSVVLTSSAPSGNVWSTGETTQSITVTTPGSYTVEEITGGCASGSSAQTDVFVNPTPATPTISAGGATSFCIGGSVVLTSTTGTSYLWSTGETTQSITVTTTGSYSVQIIDGPCTSAASNIINVTVNPIPSVPTITAGGPTTFCAGGSVVLTSSAPSGNVWSTGETTQFITVTTSGSYTVEEITAGCPSGSSASTSVTVNPSSAAPTITAGGATTFCAGGSVVLTSTAGASYLWSTGETTQSITVTTSGSYSAQIVNGSCSSTASNIINVTVNPIPGAPTISAGGPTTFCTGGSVVLTSSAASGNTWSTGATTQSITVSTSGVYTVNVTSLGCTSPNATQTITVNPIPSAPTVSAGGPTTFCAGGSVVLTSSATSGNTWSTTETTQSITVSASGSYTVTQTVLGCTSAASVPVNVTVNAIPAVPTITTSGPTTFCTGGSVVLTSSSASNNFWSNGATTQSITVSSSGTFLVQVITNGCSSGTSAPKTVTVNSLPPAPTIVTGTTESICAGSSVTLTSSSTGGNLWSSGENTQSITVSAAGNFSVTVTDGNGCVSPASPTTVVTVNPIPAAPVISPNGPTTFCSGGSVMLSSSYTSGNLWSSGSTANAITVSSNGTYSVTYTDGNGCVSSPSTPVTVTVNSIPAAPVITASGPTTFCSGGSVTLTSSYTTGNSWSTSAMTPSITATTSGVYSVIHIDGNGCASPSSAPVVVNVLATPAPPSITAGGATTICQGSFVTLTSSYTSGNTWSSGGVSQNINATLSGNYTVTYTNGNGCTSTSSPMTVTVIPVSSIPNISASGSTTICDGSSVTLTSSDPNSTWSTGATTQSIIVTTSGSYSVVGNQTGCPSQSSAPVIVNVNPAPAMPIITPSGPTTICEGEELFLFTSGTGTNTWSTGYIGQVLQVTVSGNYWVSVQNVYGCTSSSAVVPVVVNTNPIVTVNPFQPLCSYAAPFTMSNGLPAGGTYTGNGITNNIFSPGTAGIGSSIVTYTYVDVNNCSANAQTTIDVNDCAGIDEKESSYFSLFPNPNNGQFKVISTGTPMDQIIIYDAQGKMVFNESYSGIFTLEFDMNAYSNGVYYIEINSDQEIHERMPLIINH